MKLPELQRALGDLCLSETPDPALAEALGDHPSRWVIYRELVRGRALTALREALPGSARDLGPEGLERLASRFLAEAPPSSRYVRDLAPGFVGFVLGRPELTRELAPWTLERLRYEGALHEAAIAPEPCLAGVRDFAMDRPAAFTPAGRFLRVRWAVWTETPTPEPYETALFLVRDEATGRVTTLVLSPIAGDIVALALEGDRDLTACVREALARHQESAGVAFLEGLSELLTAWLEQGVLLGSR